MCYFEEFISKIEFSLNETENTIQNILQNNEMNFLLERKDWAAFSEGKRLLDLTSSAVNLRYTLKYFQEKLMPINTKKIRIVLYPHPALKKKTESIPEINDDIKLIANCMLVLVKQIKGLGLAAPQVGISLSMFVTNINESEEIYINPIIETSGPEEIQEEGCLSLPGKSVFIKRQKNVKITYQSIDGLTKIQENSDLLGRCWQHEFDHLQGKLIIDYKEKHF